MENRKADSCLCCYGPLTEEETDFHEKCCKEFFGTSVPPELPYSIDQMNELAVRMVRSQVSVTGVQPKLSLHLEKAHQVRGAGGHTMVTRDRLTIVGLWGGYIFKPPTAKYPELPEIEDLTMHLAKLAGIKTVSHTLIRCTSGELAYITRRIDRSGDSGAKIYMEDMCQLTERLAEEKYRGSMEQIGRVILTHSSNPGIDAIGLFEVTLFSYLVGNADMHLKNFSLIESVHQGERFVSLSPAYDLVATKLLIPRDKDQLALQMNGRKSNIGMGDFDRFASYLKLNEKAKTSVVDRIGEKRPRMVEFVQVSFLSTPMKEAFVKLILERATKLRLA